MIQLTHTFNVFHPANTAEGWQHKEFTFRFPVSRTTAREHVEKAEGYTIAAGRKVNAAGGGQQRKRTAKL